MAADDVHIDLRLRDDPDEEAALVAATGDDLLKLFALNYVAKRSGLGWRDEDDSTLWS